MENIISILYYTVISLFFSSIGVSLFFIINATNGICDNYMYLSPVGVFFLILNVIVSSYNIIYYIFYHRYFSPKILMDRKKKRPDKFIANEFHLPTMLNLTALMLNGILFIVGLTTLFSDQFYCVYPYPIPAIVIWLDIIPFLSLHLLLLILMRKYQLDFRDSIIA